jgi:hypothetical protein
MIVTLKTQKKTTSTSNTAHYMHYTKKQIENGQTVYRIYSGYPSDRTLFSVDGKSVSCHEITMDSLEAGVVTYEDRRRGYEALKD